MIEKAKNKFEGFLATTKDGSRVGLFWLLFAGIFATAFVFILAIIFSLFGGPPGVFGDFVGGVLNPILTFLTFMGLLLTIVLQQSELAESRVELAKSAKALEGQLNALDRQNFEATFFQMLNLHNSIVNAMDVYRGSQQTLHGRDCFRHFSKRMSHFYKYSDLDDERERVIFAHDSMWSEFSNDLAHYYRYLYNVIRFIDESNVDPVRYVRIIRSQLSNDELLILFYNGLTTRASHFNSYIERFSLFDNLPIDSLLSPLHEKFYNPNAYQGQFSQ